MNKAIVVSAAVVSSIISPPAFGQSQIMRALDEKLLWVDSAVFLMEEIPNLSLNHNKVYVNHILDSLVTDEEGQKYITKIKFLLTSIELGDQNLSRAAAIKLNDLRMEILKSGLEPHHKFLFSELCRHAKRMFENVVYDGTVFDETPHIIYYQHRLAVRQAIKREVDMEDLAARLNGLSGRVDQLCDSLVSSSTAILKSTNQAAEEQKRDKLSNNLINRRRLRYAVKDVPPTEFSKTVQGRSYKDARKALKKQLKTIGRD